MWQELKKLGLPKEDFRFSKLTEELVLNPADPLENVRFKIRRADAEKEENTNKIEYSSAEVSLSAALLLHEALRP